MMDAFYGGFKIVIAERPNFWDADIFYNNGRVETMWGWVIQNKTVTEMDVLALSYSLIDRDAYNKHEAA